MLLMLYIVSTPIGNLEDITLRAIRILKEADFIAAEDTRHVRILLDKYEIKTKVISFHSHSSASKADSIVERMKNGEVGALVSDAGTPGISDPAYALITRAIEANIKISPIPGPTALLASLVVSGKRMNNFVFLGFLPLKKGRQTLLKSLNEEDRTVIFYESPHRILKTLNQLLEFLGDKDIVICREMTKLHEEVLRLKTSEAIEHFENKKPKGEFTVII
ncbi:16S rRNA (cytidine(1402)-2'-O)-methyltransferase [Candidatus Peregrinibacteria bacterium]|nr:16S rRNA (cytidine(1402)-2'-O)-methyltransferase [Candidatus Peregrinibacteria bacterium]